MGTDMSDIAAKVALREEIPNDALILVKVLHSSETELCTNPTGVTIRKGDFVVIPTRYGGDLGRILGTVMPENAQSWKDRTEILRKAHDSDVDAYRRNVEREPEALEFCRERIEAKKLQMKLVSAHFVLDESKVLFFFTAETRVDFRDLVKDLVGYFRMRIELRQIGVRDDSRILGGIGVCGRTFCCHGLSDKIKPVSIRMAKNQDLSLSSMKISGPCGRLLCCLEYENDFYREEKKRLPSENTRIKYDGTVFRIVELNVVTMVIRLAGEDGRYMTIPTCRVRRAESGTGWEIVDTPCGTG